MIIIKQLEEQFSILSELILKLSDSEYNQKVDHLAGATIGEHTRHIIELMNTTLDGYNCDSINYEKRDRDLSLQTNQFFAVKKISIILNRLHKSDKSIKVVVDS